MGAVITVAIIKGFADQSASVINIIMSAGIAALTVGGKAIGKNIAINNNKEIVYAVGWTLSFILNIGKRGGKKG